MSANFLDTSAISVHRFSVRQIMGQVMLALVPGTALYAWLISPAVLINISMAMLAALLIEALAVSSRGRAISPVITDGSVVLAAWLFALALPPLLPLWQLLVGITAMVLLGKHLYGGLGNNPFNPAMVGYAVLLVSFPQNMTAWLATDALHDADLITLFILKCTIATPMLSGAPLAWDAIAMATPLDRLRTQSLFDGGPALTQAAINELARSSHWIWINIGYFCGGLYLLLRRVISWHMPVSLLVTLALLHGLHNVLTEAPQLAVHLSLLSGAAMLGAFFIATDPVSAATSNHGRLIYGAGIGALAFVIREYSAYPEGIAFAVLLMNMTVPALDYWSTPRTRL